MSLLVLAALFAMWMGVGVTVVCLCAMASGRQRRARSLPLRSRRLSPASSSGLRPTA